MMLNSAPVLANSIYSLTFTTVDSSLLLIVQLFVGPRELKEDFVSSRQRISLRLRPYYQNYRLFLKTLMIWMRFLNSGQIFI